MRLSVVAPYRWVANVYIEFFRGIPLLLWLFFLGYGVPTATGAQLPVSRTRRSCSGWVCRAAAYMAETIRPGSRRCPRPGRGCAVSGNVPWPAMVSIVIPQAFRIIVPPLTNEVILLTKDSSLVAILGVTAGTKE
jgi:polar amino acid transport system permease protein